MCLPKHSSQSYYIDWDNKLKQIADLLVNNPLPSLDFEPAESPTNWDIAYRIVTHVGKPHLR